MLRCRNADLTKPVGPRCSIPLPPQTCSGNPMKLSDVPVCDDSPGLDLFVDEVCRVLNLQNLTNPIIQMTHISIFGIKAARAGQLPGTSNRRTTAPSASASKLSLTALSGLVSVCSSSTGKRPSRHNCRYRGMSRDGAASPM